MRVVLQRVSSASVTVEETITGSIGQGYLVLLGVAHGDDRTTADLMLDKVLGLRLFSDDAGKMNLSISEVGGSLLVVSQFTLLADTRRGRRPSFINAAKPDEADTLYQYFVAEAGARGVPVQTGRFGAMMQVALVNDGPVTIIIDSEMS
ncbi:MAG: D-tyrosyl-tRNA(Tyr) deacylase [Acidobacteria bacterium]|nr:D-tyrosyl-tRNA(Tyr) deacylase [Acidobacteriota bacterium]MCW5950502.1 D-tyrosyl-tRNA(Tyr) deacylase [Pyrinomonadaceae bacterium]